MKKKLCQISTNSAVLQQFSQLGRLSYSLQMYSILSPPPVPLKHKPRDYVPPPAFSASTRRTAALRPQSSASLRPAAAAQRTATWATRPPLSHCHQMEEEAPPRLARAQQSPSSLPAWPRAFPSSPWRMVMMMVFPLPSPPPLPTPTVSLGALDADNCTMGSWTHNNKAHSFFLQQKWLFRQSDVVVVARRRASE